MREATQEEGVNRESKGTKKESWDWFFHHPQKESSPADMLSLFRLTCNRSLIFSPWDLLHHDNLREIHLSFLNFH